MMDADLGMPLLIVVIAFNMILGLAGWAASRVRPAWARSTILAQLLVSSFFLLMVLSPMTQADAEDPNSQRFFALALFMGVLGLLKLLGRFEENEPPSRPTS
jgi:FtsH-binding integral membrane protein